MLAEGERKFKSHQLFNLKISGYSAGFISSPNLAGHNSRFLWAWWAVLQGITFNFPLGFQTVGANYRNTS